MLNEFNKIEPGTYTTLMAYFHEPEDPTQHVTVDPMQLADFVDLVRVFTSEERLLVLSTLQGLNCKDPSLFLQSLNAKEGSLTIGDVCIDFTLDAQCKYTVLDEDPFNPHKSCEGELEEVLVQECPEDKAMLNVYDSKLACPEESFE